MSRVVSADVPSPWEVAVTVASSLSPANAPAGMSTSTENVVLSPAPNVTLTSERPVVQTPEAVRSKVSVVLPVFVMATA